MAGHGRVEIPHHNYNDDEDDYDASSGSDSHEGDESGTLTHTF